MTATIWQDQSDESLTEKFIYLSADCADQELTPHGQELRQELWDLGCELLRRDAIPAMKKLLADPRIPVRFYAAESCFGTPSEPAASTELKTLAKKVLEEIAEQQNDPLFRQRAHTALMIRFPDYIKANVQPMSPEGQARQDRFLEFLKTAPRWPGMIGEGEE